MIARFEQVDNDQNSSGPAAIIVSCIEWPHTHAALGKQTMGTDGCGVVSALGEPYLQHSILQIQSSPRENIRRKKQRKKKDSNKNRKERKPRERKDGKGPLPSL